MRELLTPLLFFQRFFIPTILILLVWAIWRTLFKKDFAVGLGLYVSLIVVVDGFYNTAIYLPGLEVGSIRYSELCALILFVVRGRAPSGATAPTALLFLVGLYFLLMLIAALRATPISAGIFEFRRIIVPQIVAFTLAIRGLNKPAEYRRFGLCMAALVLVVGLFCFWDVFFDRWILHSDTLSNPAYTHNRKIGRFGSIFLNPNFLGAFVVLVFPPLFIQSLNERQRWARLYLWISLLALVFCLTQTQSRGATLAFGAALVLLLLGPVGGMSRSRRVGFLLLFIATLVIFMPGFFERSTQRFDAPNYEEAEDGRSRYTVWQYTLRLIAEHPFGGIGLSEHQFMNAMAATDFAEKYKEVSLDNPHNSYLQAAVYAGVPALASFLIVNLLFLLRAIRSSRVPSSVDAPAIFGLGVALTGWLLCIYPDMQLFSQSVAPVYWLFMGLLFSHVNRISPVAPHKRSIRANIKPRNAREKRLRHVVDSRTCADFNN